MATGDTDKLRALLNELMDTYGSRMPDLNAKLVEAYALTIRTRHVDTIAPATRGSLKTLSDDDILELIRSALDNEGTESQRAIAARFGVDGGRVSEVRGSMRSPRLDRLRDQVARERGLERWEY